MHPFGCRKNYDALTKYLIVNRPPLPFRYAVYFCPAPDSAWGLAGAHWLGRCAATGKVVQPIQVAEVDTHQFVKLTADPRRYGWHATLKAPFKLKPHFDASDLLMAFHQLASSIKPFDLPTLSVSASGEFLSLRPEGDSSQINAVAAKCVEDLHSLALPLDDLDLARRREVNLTPYQDSLLVEWGYPWVFDQYQFHFSLTGPLQGADVPTRKALFTNAENHFANLGVCRFDRIALFIEPQSGKDFEVLKILELAE